jgi:response regulator of citrate/malate metabolism
VSEHQPGRPADRLPCRVLVVEDEPVALEAHTAYVERVPGFVVAARAATGQEAVRALQTTPVDVVLLDMNLPDRHGLDLIRSRIHL